MKKGLLLLALLAAPAAPAVGQPPAILFEPLRPTLTDPVHIKVSLTAPEGIDPRLRFSHVEGEKIVFRVGRIPSSDLPQRVHWSAETVVGPLEKGVYTIVVDSEDGFDFQRTFQVIEPGPGLILRDEIDTFFSVGVDFEPPPGSNLRGTGFGVPVTRESGYFWFFDPDNVEATVKILDGRPVNGRYWIFVASMTDLPLRVTVTHCPKNPAIGAPCESRQYRTEPGVNQNIIDVDFLGF